MGRVLDHQFLCPSGEAERLLKDVPFLAFCLLIIDLHAPPSGLCRRAGHELDLDELDRLQPPGQDLGLGDNVGHKSIMFVDPNFLNFQTRWFG